MASSRLPSVYHSFFKRAYFRLSLLRPPEATRTWFKPHLKIAGNYQTSNHLRYYCCNSPASSQERLSTFKPLVDVSEIPHLSNAELFEVISHLRDSVLHKTNKEMKTIQHTPYVEAINEECVRRAQENWNLDEAIDVVNMFSPKSKFLCAELLFWLLRMRFKKAMKSPVSTMMKYVDAITKNEFWKAYHINWYLTEFALIRNLDQFDLAQVSSLVNILNKRSAVVVSQELIVDLYDRLIKEVDQADRRVLNVFLEFFSVQKRTKGVDYDSLLNIVSERLASEDFPVNQTLCLFCTRKKIHNQRILDHLAEYLTNNLPDIRVANLETIVATLVFFNYESRDVYQKVIDSFDTEPLSSGFLNHPKRFVKLISNLSLLGVYPYDHVNRVLSEEFLRKTYGKKLSHYNIPREISILDGCIKAECPDYEGNKLSKDLEGELLTWYTSHIHHYLQTEGDTIISKGSGKIEYTPSPHNKIILETRKILRKLLGGSEYVHTGYVLPFLPRPDLLFGFDEEKKAVELSDSVLNSIHVDYKNLNERVDWYVVISGGQHPTLKDNVVMYGKGVTKNRILKKHGFKLITIIEEIWFGLEEQKKENYLRSLIS